MTVTAMLWVLWFLAVAEIVMVPVRRQIPEGSGLVYALLLSVVVVWPTIVWMWL